jgi:long-subunit fatty acid transport protein
VQADEITKVGTTAAQFLKIGVGARAAGMGESFVAVADDGSSIFWNPAGLAALKKNELILEYNSWIADISYNFGAIAIPTKSAGTFALFVNALTMGEMDRTTEYEPQGTGEKFGATDLALGVSYAMYFTQRFAFGINAKFIKQQIWQETANGFAVDLGIIYHTELEGLSLGMTLSNFGDKMRMDGTDLKVFHDIDPNNDGNNEQIIANLNTEAYDIPLIFRIGLAYNVIKTDFMRLTVSFDAVSPNDYQEYLNGGLEYSYSDYFYIRGGYKGIGLTNSEVGFALGGGVNIPFDESFQMKVDYAYTDFGRLGDVQRITLSTFF